MTRRRCVVICILLGTLFGGRCGLGGMLWAQPAGQDLRLTYRSEIDATDTDAMRAATGADIALYSALFYRGLPIPKGTVDVVDLVQCSRPFDQYLVTVRLIGRDIIGILDLNADPKKLVRSDIDTPGFGRVVQIFGARYRFDPRLPAGKRIVETDLEPDCIYTVALEGQVVERDTILLAGRFEKLDYQTTDVPFTLAQYGHAAKSGSVKAQVEGRVREVGQ